jgi:predicted DCC family thiol-disulfide oxidoreductase YuxK
MTRTSYAAQPQTQNQGHTSNHDNHARYKVIYDGNCNLCVGLVQLLEKLDRGEQFTYAPMQDLATLASYGITAVDCEMGMILIDADSSDQRWQGSDAAEEIGRLLPVGDLFVQAYRSLPGLKWLGDRTYAQIRDHRYAIFGKRDRTYQSAYPIGCGQFQDGDCSV